MKKRSLVLTAIVAIASLFIAGMIVAADFPATIKMEDSAYKKHKKGIVTFTHEKHFKEYKVGCGECHHDKDSKALDKLKVGDSVQKCIECHKETKKVKGKKLSDAKKREYHAQAMHDNCKDCHKKFNKKNKLKDGKDKNAAPTKCKTCHPKK
ncbi:Cytochrome C [Candidatus Magnetomoraceae bacterium gMMP-15]